MRGRCGAPVLSPKSEGPKANPLRQRGEKKAEVGLDLSFVTLTSWHFLCSSSERERI